MNKRNSILGLSVALLLGASSITLVFSCADKEPANPPAKTSAGSDAAQEAPEIPIDVMPKLLRAPVAYPEEARIRGEQGMVYVKALVGKDGTVKQAEIDPKQPVSDVLGKAAVEAVKQWTFEPAQAKGEPAEVWIVVPVNFKLR